MTGLPAIPMRGANPCRSHGCSRCCHGTEMLLTEEDVARIAAARPGVDFHFRAPDGYLQLRTRDGPGAMPDAGPPCVFLDAAGLCTVHGVRPEGCRLYPAVWDGRGARLDDAECPHTDGFALPRATGDAVRRLAARLESERRARTAAGPPPDPRGGPRTGVL